MDYLSILGLKSTHVSNKRPVFIYVLKVVLIGKTHGA